MNREWIRGNTTDASTVWGFHKGKHSILQLHFYIVL